ncbi:MAG: neutral zinc metallopeptidase [Chloroflexota bacterium]
MTFGRGTKLDPGQVQDRRGGRGRGLALGGVGGLIVLAAALFLNIDLSGLPLDQLGGGAQEANPSSDLQTACLTEQEANTREDCQIVGFVNSIQAYWTDTVEGYTEADTVIFTGSVDTGCGAATSAVGPFYCPPDQTVYLDLGFFDQLREQFGAEGGPLARGYVLAHEYGHHIQNLTGQLSPGGQTGAESQAVRTELQADCYAGAWAANADESTQIPLEITDQQIAQALDAAAAVGDDRIQEQVQGQVNPETWTHGSSEQRQHWFRVGYESGDPNRCDTSGEI